MTIGWVKFKSRRYGGVIYEEKAMESLKSDFDLEYIKVDSRIFRKGYLRAPELLFNLLKLKGKKDLWIRDSNTVIGALFDRTRGKKAAVIHHLDFSTSRPVFKTVDFFIERLIRRGLKKMDAVITVSEYWKERLLKDGLPNVFVIHNSFDVDDFDVSDKEAEAFKEKQDLTGKPVIYLGNCQKAKGVLESYQALKDLDVHLVTSGEVFVKIPARNLRLSYPDYLKLLKTSSIVLTMSRFREGWCRTAHEAMLLKVPVIGSGLGGMRELLEEGKQIICSDFNELRKKVEYLLEHPEARIKIGQAGFDFARNFTSERFKNEWLLLIDKLLHK